MPRRNVVVVGATHEEVIRAASPAVAEVLRTIVESRLTGTLAPRDAIAAADEA